jgi:four helix bundle protein
MKNFKNLAVWQKSMNLVVKTYQLSKDLPNEEKFGLISQMTRAAVSVPSNIAEGSSRRSDKDYARFLEIALGSSFELETLVLITQMLEMGSEEKIYETNEKIVEVQKMLNSFIKQLSKG